METSEPVKRTSEIEEPTNLYVIHPLSSALTAIFARVGITPNAVSMTGMLFGILAGIAYFHYREPGWAVAGFALMIAWHVMDGADGQLARLTNAQSELGKILDGICDYVTFIAVYTALAASLSRTFGNWAWLLAFVAALFHAIQSAAYELQRQDYMFWGLGRKSGELKIPDVLPARAIARAMYAIFRLYVRCQFVVAGLMVNPRQRLAAMVAAQPDRVPLIRERYREIFAPSVRRWSIMSANYRTIGIFLAAALGRPDIYFWFEIFGFSALILLLNYGQRRRYAEFFASLDKANPSSQTGRGN